MKCGIIDVGSNTIRLSIYHYEGRQFKLLMNKKEMAGLASYIHDGLLSDSGVLVACRVLSSFKALLENLGIEALYVFGTAPLRNIANTEDALDTIQAITGMRVDVLSGADEAKFSFLGATWRRLHRAGCIYGPESDVRMQSSHGLPVSLFQICIRPVSHLW